jgi:MFS family permease
MRQAHDPYAALRHRDYRSLLLGSFLASVASETQAAAVGWELFQRTSDPAYLGYVGLVQFLPVLLLSLPAGQAVDRHSRKVILAGAEALLALAALALAGLSLAQGPVLGFYPCVLLAGVAQAFGAPARWALIPAVVPSADLPNAATWGSSGWQLAAVTGPALAGGLIALTGSAPAAYLASAVCALACAALALTLRPRPHGHTGEPASLTNLLAGARFIAANKPILATLTLDLFAVLLGGATALLPAFATDVLRTGPFGFGCLRAAPSTGALVMMFALAHRPPLRRPGRTLLWAVAGFGAVTIVFGLSHSPALSFAMLVLAGAFDMISVVVRGTLIQVLTPDAMRGRVSAVNLVFIGSSNQLGEFESGMTAKWFGLTGSVVGGGVGTILVVLAVTWAWPQLLRLGPLHAVHEPPPETPDKAGNCLEGGGDGVPEP